MLSKKNFKLLYIIYVYKWRAVENSGYQVKCFKSITYKNYNNYYKNVELLVIVLWLKKYDLTEEDYNESRCVISKFQDEDKSVNILN